MQGVAQGKPMSTWTDKVGRRHVGIMAGGKRVHRILPPGSTASNAKQLEAEIRTALGNSKAPQIPGDPKLTEIMTLYMAHADTLRSPDTAKHHALRIGQWLENIAPVSHAKPQRISYRT